MTDAHTLHLHWKKQTNKNLYLSLPPSINRAPRAFQPLVPGSIVFSFIFLLIHRSDSSFISLIPHKRLLLYENKILLPFSQDFWGVCGNRSKTTYKFLPQLPDALLEQIPRNPHNRRPDPQKSNQSSRQRKTQTAPMSCQHRKSRPSLWPNRWSEGPSGHSSRTENVTSRNARGITQSTQCLVCGRLQRRNRRSTQTAECLKSCDIVWRSLIPHCDLWPMCWITDDVTRGRAILKSPGGFSHPLQFDLLL